MTSAYLKVCFLASLVRDRSNIAVLARIEYNVHIYMSLSYDTKNPKVKVPVHSSSAPLRDRKKGFAVLDC